MSLPAAAEEVIDASKAAIAKYSDMSVTPLERFEFYVAARSSFAVVQTSERRPYANFLLRKGVVGPDGKDLKP